MQQDKTNTDSNITDWSYLNGVNATPSVQHLPIFPYGVNATYTWTPGGQTTIVCSAQDERVPELLLKVAWLEKEVKDLRDAIKAYCDPIIWDTLSELNEKMTAIENEIKHGPPLRISPTFLEASNEFNANKEKLPEKENDTVTEAEPVNEEIKELINEVAEPIASVTEVERGEE